MSLKTGALIGATIALFFYAFLSMITPFEEKSIFPTAMVAGDTEGTAQYVRNLPTSMIIFISLEVVGMVLGAIGYRIIVGSTPKQPMAEKGMKKG